MQITAQVKDTGPAMLVDFSDGARAVVGSFPDAAADALKTITGGEAYAPSLHAAIDALEEISAEKAARFFMN